jgi:hypothetical protein
MSRVILALRTAVLWEWGLNVCGIQSGQRSGQCKTGGFELGYYAIAFTWARFICILLYDTVNYVLYPTLSSIQNDLAVMRC